MYRQHTREQCSDEGKRKASDVDRAAGNLRWQVARSEQPCTEDHRDGEQEAEARRVLAPEAKVHAGTDGRTAAADPRQCRQRLANAYEHPTRPAELAWLTCAREPDISQYKPRCVDDQQHADELHGVVCVSESCEHIAQRQHDDHCHRSRQHQPADVAPPALADDGGDVVAVDDHHTEQRRDVQGHLGHDSGRVDAEPAASQHEMPAGADGQELRQPLDDTEQHVGQELHGADCSSPLRYNGVMAADHEFAQQFTDHMAATQNAYTERRLDDYIAGFSDDYCGAAVGSDFGEDKATLERKIAVDLERYELLSMEYDVLRHWYAGDTGFAHLRYRTRLRQKATQRVLVDARENLIVGKHLGNGHWTLISKIMLSAVNHFEVGEG